MSYYYNAHLQHPTPAVAPAVGHAHHGGRSRRAPRLSVSQNAHKQQQQPPSQPLHHHAQHPHAAQQFRHMRSIKGMADSLNLTAFRMKFEAGRSFDLEDDLEFCPGLLSESDLVSIHSASSERSSLASNSPEHSPSQPAQAAPAFSLNASSPSFTLPSLKLHQPAATRARNPIPIVHPSSRPGSHLSMAAPGLPSASPSMRLPQQALASAW